MPPATQADRSSLLYHRCAIASLCSGAGCVRRVQQVLAETPPQGGQTSYSQPVIQKRLTEGSDWSPIVGHLQAIEHFRCLLRVSLAHCLTNRRPISGPLKTTPILPFWPVSRLLSRSSGQSQAIENLVETGAPSPEIKAKL